MALPKPYMNPFVEVGHCMWQWMDYIVILYCGFIGLSLQSPQAMSMWPWVHTVCQTLSVLWRRATQQFTMWMFHHSQTLKWPLVLLLQQQLKKKKVSYHCYKSVQISSHVFNSFTYWKFICHSLSLLASIIMYNTYPFLCIGLTYHCDMPALY